jgi:hypothetical protein
MFNLLARSRWVWVAAALCGSLLLSACGGSGGGSSSENAPSKKAFLKQADAICEKADAREGAGLSSYSAKHPQPTSGDPKAWEEQLAAAVGLPALQSEAEELRALQPPADGEDQVAAITDAIEAAVEQGEESPGEIILPAGENAFAEAEELARAYGLKVCGEI